MRPRRRKHNTALRLRNLGIAVAAGTRSRTLDIACVADPAGSLSACQDRSYCHFVPWAILPQRDAKYKQTSKCLKHNGKELSTSAAPISLSRHDIYDASVDRSFFLFFEPGGLPLRFRVTADIHAGGRPRRFPCPAARRSSTRIACSSCSRSCRSSVSILSTFIEITSLPCSLHSSHFSHFYLPGGRQQKQHCRKRPTPR